MKETDGLEFSVVGDGKVLWSSGLVKKSDGLKTVEVAVAGVRSLVLKVAGTGEPGRWRRPQGDWIEAKLGR